MEQRRELNKLVDVAEERNLFRKIIIYLVANINQRMRDQKLKRSASSFPFHFAVLVQFVSLETIRETRHINILLFQHETVMP